MATSCGFKTGKNLKILHINIIEYENFKHVFGVPIENHRPLEGH
jgi:hypothetical protein